MSDPIVIVGLARTPMGGFQGELSGATASQLGAVAIKAALERAGVAAVDVDEVLMGNVLGAGQGQAPARQAAFAAGLPKSVPCTTLNKMCGSGMKTAMIAHDQLLAGNGRVVVAGGMESMTNAPYILPKMRGGARLGHTEVKDHMFLDGLEDAYDKGRLMGTFAEDCAEKFQFTREQQDAYALASLDGALSAQKEGRFDAEITPVTIETRKGAVEVSTDEQPRNARPDKIPTLKPVFRKGGTVTPANSSSISDGAAALVLMRESEAKRRGLEVRARILGHAAAELDGRGCGPVGGQRSLRRGADGGDGRTGDAAREAERQRRGLCAGAPDRGLGCADHRDAAARDGEARRQARHRQPVHRRRRGHGGGDRAGVSNETHQGHGRRSE
jgi:acetyl-CoA C-acetyltransferase